MSIPLLCALALPLFALLNALLVFVFTALGIPLAWWSFLGGYVVMAMLMFFIGRRLRVKIPTLTPTLTRTHPPLFVVCSLILLPVILFSFIHVLILPTTTVDSFTNWTMRSQVSWADRAIAFDRDESRGVAKPQYPFLVHALQIAANQGRQEWSDRMANGITLALSLSAWIAAFLLLKRLRGSSVALATVTACASLPMIAIHLGQGYGDIHLVEYLALALLGLALFREERSAAWLFLSALMIAGAMWTKLEGLWIGFIPWAGILIWEWMRRRGDRKHIMMSLSIPFLSFLLFLLFLSLQGLPLTPHASDSSLSWHSEALSPILRSMFAFGSFGILWYLLPFAFLFLKRHWILGFWALGALAIVIATYLLTPNAEYSINGEAFSRQLMAPAILLILAIILGIDWHQVRGRLSSRVASRSEA